MSEESWRLVSANGLRFYYLEPAGFVKLMFTTRRMRDEAQDHGLGVRDQLSRAGLDYPLVTMKQSHSDHVVMVARPGEVDADGCFTIEPDLALAVKVADCVPIYVYGEKEPLIGIVHAGWRGTMSKIAVRFLEKVLEETDIEPHRLRFVLGPSIGKDCYKVGEEVLDAFRKTWPEAGRFFKNKRNGLFLDLRAANRFLLSSMGAVEGSSLEMCTHCYSTRFYSYRREQRSVRNWGIIVRSSNE